MAWIIAILTLFSMVGVFLTLGFLVKNDRAEKRTREIHRNPFDSTSVLAWIIREEVTASNRDWEPFWEQPDSKSGDSILRLPIGGYKVVIQATARAAASLRQVNVRCLPCSENKPMVQSALDWHGRHGGTNSHQDGLGSI